MHQKINNVDKKLHSFTAIFFCFFL